MEKEMIDYGFYSNLLNKPFGTLKELRTAEDEFKKKNAAEIAKKEERRVDSAKVSDAYQKYMNACRKANEDIAKARSEWLGERQKFIDKYNSFHMSYTNDNGKEEITVCDAFKDFFKFLMNF